MARVLALAHEIPPCLHPSAFCEALHWPDSRLASRARALLPAPRVLTRHAGEIPGRLNAAKAPGQIFWSYPLKLCTLHVVVFFKLSVTFLGATGC